MALSNEAIRNHYVPQCYQSSWQIPHPKRSKWIGVNTKDRNCKERAIRSNACKEHFYDPELEAALGRIETDLGKVLQKIKNREEISGAERGALIAFITTQLRRNIVGQRRTEIHMKELIETHQPESVERLTNLVMNGPGPLRDRVTEMVALEELVNRFYQDRKSRDLPKGYFTEVILRARGIFSKILAEELIWLFYVSDGTEEFVTSDNPVILPKEGLLARPEVLFPICPEVCLVARKPKKTESSEFNMYVDIPGKRVKRINARIIAGADEEVYTRGVRLTREQAATIGTEVWGERLRVEGVTNLPAQDLGYPSNEE